MNKLGSLVVLAVATLTLNDAFAQDGVDSRAQKWSNYIATTQPTKSQQNDDVDFQKVTTVKNGDTYYVSGEIVTNDGVTCHFVKQAFTMKNNASNPITFETLDCDEYKIKAYVEGYSTLKSYGAKLILKALNSQNDNLDTSYAVLTSTSSGHVW